MTEIQSKLLAKCLKPEEISGDANVCNDRLDELIRWFVRYSEGKANQKWADAHAYELAFYIARMKNL